MLGREVVIVEAVRTPVGRGHPEKGAYRDVHPNALLGTVFTEVIARSGIEAVEPSRTYHRLRDAVRRAVAEHRPERVVAGRASDRDARDDDRPAVRLRPAGRQLRRRAVASGVHDVVIGGGVEHMGHIPMSAIGAIVEEYGSSYPPELLERYDLIPQGLSAELIAETWGISREECDAFALRSQERAAPRRPRGRFDRELVPFGVNGSTVTADQGIRPETTLEGLASLKPAFKEDGRHTPATRRRSRTARPPCSSRAASRRTNAASRHARASSTTSPSASTQ